MDRAWAPWVLVAMVAAVYASRVLLPQGRALRAEISSDTLELTGGGVPTKKGRYLFPLSDISDVQLLSVLPEGMPDHQRLDSMRGVFDVPELGRVVVLLDRMEPPFLLLRVDWLADGQSHVLLRLKDEQRTSALFERLHAERGDPRLPGEPSDEPLEVEAE